MSPARFPMPASNAFRKAYSKLSRLKRRKVDTAIEKYLESPELPGLNVERLSGTDENILSIRATRSVRILIRRQDDGEEVLDFVGVHDKAYRRAEVAYWAAAHPEFSESDSGFYSSLQSETQMETGYVEELERTLEEAEVESLNVPDLAGMIRGLLEEVVADGTDGRASSSIASDAGGGDWINLIPSEHRAPCTEVLVAFCFDADSFRNRLDEVHHHAGVLCPETKLIVLVTSKWQPKTWKKHHRDRFADLPARMIALMAIEGDLRPVL